MFAETGSSRNKLAHLDFVDGDAVQKPLEGLARPPVDGESVEFLEVLLARERNGAENEQQQKEEG